MLKKSRKKSRSKIKEIEGLRLHDCAMLWFKLSDDMGRVRVGLYSPEDGPEDDPGRYYEITFDAVMKLYFESVSTGDQSLPMIVMDVYPLEDEEYHRWLRRLDDLKKYGKETTTLAGYKGLYHAVDGITDMIGWGENEDLFGAHIVCRHIAVEDMSEEYRGHRRPVTPYPIPAG